MGFSYSPLSTFTLILILGADFIESGDQLVERLPIDHETGGAIWRVADDVSCSKIITEKINHTVC